MKKIILLAFLLLPVLAQAQKLPWPEGKPCARVLGLDPDNRFMNPVTARAFIGNAFREIEEMIAILQGKPKVEISFEYLQYRFGYQVLASAEYSADCQTFEADDEEITELRKKSEAGNLSAADFKGPRWIHMVQAIDVEEVNCLALSKVNGALGGCNDLWQDGVTEDETVCVRGRNYMKCHIECIEKIYNRNIEKTAGLCAEQE